MRQLVRSLLIMLSAVQANAQTAMNVIFNKPEIRSVRDLDTVNAILNSSTVSVLKENQDRLLVQIQSPSKEVNSLLQELKAKGVIEQQKSQLSHICDQGCVTR